MRYLGITLLALITGTIGWMGLVRKPLPPVPEIAGTLSKEVPLSFTIQSMNYNAVELSLKEKVGGKGMFVHFSMANAWKTGRPGLVLQGMSASSGLRGMSARKYLDDPKRKENKGKDFSDFMQDNAGKPVSAYQFKQTLVEGRNGQTFMLIAYNGPAMEMIQTLEVARPVTLPEHVSRLFVEKGIIQFKPGTVAFDSRSKGFYIPVEIR